MLGVAKLTSEFRRSLYPLLLTLAGIATLGWAASANALERDARTAATAARLRHALSESADLCPTKVDPAIREYIFIFEGAGGYAPAQAILKTADLHTKVKIGYELFNWSIYGSSPLPKDARGNFVFPAEWSAEKNALYQVATEALEEDGHGSMLDLIYYASDYYREYPKRILYYDYTTPGDAAECAKSLKKLYAAARRPIAFSAAGFSLGGYATIRFARKLNSNQIRLKNVLTIDPVPYTHEVLRALDGRRNGTVIEVPGNHDHWYNLFQRRDVDTLQTRIGNFPIRGAKLSGGVKNRIPVQNSGAEVSEHMQMPTSDVAVAEMERILNQ